MKQELLLNDIACIVMNRNGLSHSEAINQAREILAKAEPPIRKAVEEEIKQLYPIMYQEEADEVGDFIRRGWIPPEEALLIRKDEREKYDEAVLLVVDVAGLNQSIFSPTDILGLAYRAEEILQALKEGH